MWSGCACAGCGRWSSKARRRTRASSASTTTPDPSTRSAAGSQRDRCSARESQLVTDIANSQPANSFAGLSVRAGADSSGPRQRRRDAAAVARQEHRPYRQHPPAPPRCALSIVPGHALYQDFRRARLAGPMLASASPSSDVEAGGSRRYEVLLPVSGSPDRAGLPLVTTLAEPVAMGVVAVTAADDKQHTQTTAATRSASAMRAG